MSGVTVYIDSNQDGQLDLGEISTTTDTAGNYTFFNLPQGDYKVREVLPAQFALDGAGGLLRKRHIRS